MPEVSVVLPVFNRARTLERAVKSVLDQTFEDFELIVVDDASSDQSAEVARGIRDRRIVVNVSSRNVGPARARNRGIAVSRGRFIAFLDSDDAWTPAHLELAMDIFKEDAVASVTYGKMQVRSGDSSFVTPPSGLGSHGSAVLRSLCRGNTIGLPAIIVRRDVLIGAGGFNAQLRTLEDWDLLLRLAATGHDFRYIDKVVLNADESQDGVNRISEATLHATMGIRESVMERLPDGVSRRRLEGQLRYLEGLAYVEIGEHALARRSFFGSLMADPQSPKGWLSSLLFTTSPTRFQERLLRAKRLRRTS